MKYLSRGAYILGRKWNTTLQIQVLQEILTMTFKYGLGKIYSSSYLGKMVMHGAQPSSYIRCYYYLYQIHSVQCLTSFSQIILLVTFPLSSWCWLIKKFLLIILLCCPLFIFLILFVCLSIGILTSKLKITLAPSILWFNWFN